MAKYEACVWIKPDGALVQMTNQAYYEGHYDWVEYNWSKLFSDLKKGDLRKSVETCLQSGWVRVTNTFGISARPAVGMLGTARSIKKHRDLITDIIMDARKETKALIVEVSFDDVKVETFRLPEEWEGLLRLL